jgi:hypothetical protein
MRPAREEIMSKGLRPTRAKLGLATLASAVAVAAVGITGVAPAQGGGERSASTAKDSGAATAAQRKRGPRRYRGPRIKTRNASRCDWLDPTVCLFPWPNNRFTRPASTPTGRLLNLNARSMPKNKNGVPINPTEWNRNDGFSPGQAILVHIPGMDNQAAFNRSGIVPVTNIRAYANGRQPVVLIDTVTKRRHPILAELDARAPNAASRHLIIRPTVNLVEGRRYIVALRNLRKANGGKIKPRNAFRVYRDRLITRQRPVERRRRQMNGIFRTLRQAGIPRKNLYLAWDFTVASEQSIAGRVLAMRNDAFARLGDSNLADNVIEPGSDSPVIKDTSFEATPSDPNILGIGRGEIEVPCYLDQNGCAPGSKFAFDGPNDRFPNFNSSYTMDAPFECVFPRSLQDGTDVDPARAVSYGHGLLGSYTEAGNGVNRVFANEHHLVFCGTNWAGFAAEDVNPVIIPSLSELSRLPKTFDRVQQGFVNFMYLGRAMIHPDGFNDVADFQFDFGGGSEGAIDTSEGLGFQGISQGAVEGGALTALNPDFRFGALDVNGMNYSTLLERSIDFDLYDTLLQPNYPNHRDRQLTLSLLQNVWDRGETNGYARHMTTDPYPNTPSHRVLMHAAYGDHQVSNLTAEIEARTVGARIVTPALKPGRHWEASPFFGLTPLTTYPYAGSALVYYDGGPAAFTGSGGQGTDKAPPSNTPNRTGADPHGYPRRVPAAQAQYATFFDTGTIQNPCGSTLVPMAAPCFSNGYTGTP